MCKQTASPTVHSSLPVQKNRHWVISPTYRSNEASLWFHREMAFFMELDNVIAEGGRGGEDVGGGKDLESSTELQI